MHRERGIGNRSLAAIHTPSLPNRDGSTPSCHANQVSASTASCSPSSPRVVRTGSVRQVLDGMLRERSGGEAGAVLRASMRIGRGTV